MKFFAKGAAILAAAALFPVAAAAQQPAPQGPPQGPAQGRGGMAPRQMSNPRPQLTEQQREQMRALGEQQRTALEAAHRELGDLQRQLNEQLGAAELDNAKINALRSAIVQKETALAEARVDRLTKLSALLTAEQRQALRGRGIGQMFGPGGPGGRGGRGGRGGMMGRREGMMGGGRGGMMQRRHGIGPRMQGFRGGRGAGAPRGGAGDVLRLRAEIRRLEAQINALRRRIR